MKFVVDKNILQDALLQVSKIVPNRSTMPILNCALFAVSGNRLIIKSTNLDTYISSEIDINTGEDGSICIPVIKLNEILSALPDCELNFSISANGKITINNNVGNYSIMALNPEEFPSEPILESISNIDIEAKLMQNMINNTLYAASKDDLKPVLQGVLFNIENNTITGVATDGHRLVKTTNSVDGDYNQKVIVPSKFLSALMDNLKSNQNISLQLSDNHIMVQLTNINIISRIIKDQYPDFESVIPYENNKEVRIDKHNLIDAVKRVSIFSNKTTKQISLSFSDGEATISTEDPDNITSAKEIIQCDYEGENIIIGYNAVFLLEILKKQNGSTITIKLENSLTAGIFISEPEKEEDTLTLLMPTRLNN